MFHIQVQICMNNGMFLFYVDFITVRIFDYQYKLQSSSLGNLLHSPITHLASLSLGETTNSKHRYIQSGYYKSHPQNQVSLADQH
jgi:hypothetical protein